MVWSNQLLAAQFTPSIVASGMVYHVRPTGFYRLTGQAIYYRYRDGSESLHFQILTLKVLKSFAGEVSLHFV